MNRIHKTSAIIAAGVTFIAACFGIQTFYSNNGATGQVAVSASMQQNSENSGIGYECSSNAKNEITTLQLATSSSTSSLQSSLESENAERKTQDEKISKSIGNINNTLLGYIGSASTNKIGDGTLRGAIGNNSIAGIGTENNLSSAVNGLNGKISTNTGSIKDLQTETSSLNIDKLSFINSNSTSLYESYERSHPTDNTSYTIWTATEDCWATGYGRAYSSAGYYLFLSIDGTRVATVTSVDNNCFMFPVKKGQTVYKANGYLEYIAFLPQA